MLENKLKVLSLFDGIYLTINYILSNNIKTYKKYMALIYQITNTINGKIYIGQTKTSLYKRFRSHKSNYLQKRYSESYLYNAFKKYGTNAFTIHKIIEDNFTQEELNKLEIEYIKKYNSLSPNGYNLTEGGNCASKTLETRKKLSEKLKGRKIKWKEKISLGVKKLWEDKEYKEKQTLQKFQTRGKYRDGIVKPFRLKIDIKELQTLFNNGFGINELAKKYNTNFEAIKKRICRDKILRKNGFKDLPTEEIISLYKQGHTKKYLCEKYNISYQTLNSRLYENK